MRGFMRRRRVWRRARSMRATTFIAVLIALLSSTVLAAPLAAEAQQPAKVFRLGLLGTVPLTEPGASRIWDGFLEGLWQLGYVEGQNIVIEVRFSEGRYERVPALAAELVRLKVDVIVAASHTADAAKGATSRPCPDSPAWRPCRIRPIQAARAPCERRRSRDDP